MAKKKAEPKVEKKEGAAAIEGFGDLIKLFAKEMEKTKDWLFGDKIKYPLTVNSLKMQGRMGVSPGRGERVGSFVSIRPVAEEHKGKTFLGLYIGDVPLSISTAYDPKAQDLHITLAGNPAIFVFDLNKVVHGAESWWGEIESEDQLRKITDNDIQNVWYVKAMKQLVEREAKKKADEPK